ncbi:hypothetical protein K6Q96_23835 [Grimontia kaedaensis]|uniref:Uncharacterized protein n=1 Tax=Grimontia kaedaensis TaxID=2872157 RepID=A0ABY4X0K8_9GAMM|nr:hypothetical protein [Grimontia kaedaensis]USH04745.1 hypothetical protein K6Q96_23835 [Grimontia kaedaensis]
MKKLVIAALVLFGLMGTAFAFDTHLTHGLEMPEISLFGCDHGSHH